MKRYIRIVALILSLCMLLCVFSGCNKVKKNDDYVTKAEFMLMFTDGMGLTTVSASDGRVNEACNTLVELGFLTEEEATKDLDKAVTKEFVANLCVNSLYFRKTADVILKDEGKLKDPQACKDAVGHGIVDIDNGYFDAYEKMTYNECQKAIDATKLVDATGTFDGKGEIEIVLDDDVINISDEFDDSTLNVIDPDSEGFDEIIAGMKVEQVPVKEEKYVNRSMATENMISIPQNNAEIEKKIPYVIPGSTVEAIYSSYEEAEENDCIVVGTIRKWGTVVHKVGDKIIYGIPKEVGNPESYPFCGEVVAVNNSSPVEVFYTVRIADEDKYIISAKINEYNSKNNGIKWNVEKCAPDEKLPSGMKVMPLKITNDGFKITIEHTAKNKIESKKDAQFEIDMEYTFEIKDIALQVDGFGGIFFGEIDDAICRLDYTIIHDFDAKTELKGAPYNNGNGKFLSNLKRSRLTGANAAGASEIKIARMYADLGYGLNIEFYVYLTVELDGSIGITIERNYANGFKIINNRYVPLDTSELDKKNHTSIDAHANLEAGVHLDVYLRWLKRSGKSLADVKFEVGIGADVSSKVDLYDEKSDKYTETIRGYMSKDELDSAKEKLNLEYCIDGRIYAYYEIEGLTSKSKVGKIIRFFKDDFKLKSEKEIDITKFHIEDNKIVQSCTRDHKEEEVESEKEENFVLNTYKVLVPMNACGTVWITGFPVNSKEMFKMGGIRISIKDSTIASIKLVDNMIMINPLKPGSTEIVIETPNKRFIQECSVTISNVADSEE